jgi:hypothetical protein
VAGLLIVAVGIVVIVLGFHAQHACMAEQGRVNGMDVAASVATCSGDGRTAGLGFLICGIGAGVFFSLPSWALHPGGQGVQPITRSRSFCAQEYHPRSGELGHPSPVERTQPSGT